MDNTAEARGLLSVIIFSRIGHPAVPYITPSQVSCRWRHIALNTQSFWATLLLNDVNWGQELIRRSGRVPLHVYRNRPVLGGPHSTTFIKCLSQALTQSHRIEVIDFDGAFSSSGISWKSLPLYFTETLQGVKLSNVRMITVSEIPQDGEWIKALLNLSITQSWNTIRELDITRSPVIRLPKSSNGHLVRLRLTLIPPSDIIALMETLMYLHNLEMLTLSSERGALEPPPQSWTCPQAPSSSGARSGTPFINM
ncbi:hypothetical protein DL96DRAFT_1101633 [Flagelloscypha sp. PMI_526]|nr:hypothetical protein DL96DRAFT_1101633 [Flagelloscypha sp. PMI_526]